MTDKVYEQIMRIRDSGKYNMFDAIVVQREAFELGFNELVLFIKEYKDEYVQFILTGQR